MPMSLSVRKRRVVIATVVALSAGCPTRFDPRAETLKSSPDAEADHAYREARARLDVGDLKEAEARFATFLEKWPNDPLAPSAKLGEARAALGTDFRQVGLTVDTLASRFQRGAMHVGGEDLGLHRLVERRGQLVDEDGQRVRLLAGGAACRPDT